MEKENDQVVQRGRKLSALREMGVHPYGARFDGATPLAQIIEKHSATNGIVLEAEPISYKIAGRMMSLRRFGKAAFAHLKDQSGSLQVYFKKDYCSQFDLFEQLDIGDHLGLSGILFRTKTDELTLQVHHLTLLSKSLRPLPEKWHGLTDIELRYRMRYVDLIANPETQKVFMQRAKIIEMIRGFLREQMFIEVETPMMHPIPGGAAARPFVTHHNSLGVDLYLRIAPELYLKRLLVGGFERVFEINRNFRNEGISTIHNPEFTMLEFYMAYADYDDLIVLTEQMISGIAKRLYGKYLLSYQGQAVDLTPPWKRLSYLNAIAGQHSVTQADLMDLTKVCQIADRAKLNADFRQPLYKILNVLFEETVEPHLTGPVFITDYPIEISPLAKRKVNAPHLTDRFELYIAGMEVANAFSELNDPEDQRVRFEAQRKDANEFEKTAMDEDYLMALEYGMPPAAGEGIGIDRLVMLLTDQSSIRDVIFFPQMKPHSPTPLAGVALQAQ